jgi:hypothetical protein
MPDPLQHIEAIAAAFCAFPCDPLVRMATARALGGDNYTPAVCAQGVSVRLTPRPSQALHNIRYQK